MTGEIYQCNQSKVDHYKLSSLIVAVWLNRGWCLKLVLVLRRVVFGFIMLQFVILSQTIVPIISHKHIKNHNQYESLDHPWMLNLCKISCFLIQQWKTFLHVLLGLVHGNLLLPQNFSLFFFNFFISLLFVFLFWLLLLSSFPAKLFFLMKFPENLWKLKLYHSNHHSGISKIDVYMGNFHPFFCHIFMVQILESIKFGPCKLF